MVVVLSLLAAGSAVALPFNDDMVLNEMKTGRIMRPLPDGAVPFGSAEELVQSREEALQLVNPIKGDPRSAQNGERLFKVHCLPCHGDISAVPYVPGTVSKYLPGPNLSLDMYAERTSGGVEGRSDGSIYGTIHFGSVTTLMPAVGWKLSPVEHWDIINYIRKVQAATK